ncbi:UNVERIFIED_CONTAM: Aminopeptidase M1 [Sesamum calycinum]|uniref:Alpha-aminoacylpeptide hydrolase n=1 Tax=Sesamum calycinum TaxID=2727403 RepID=A0AAW2NG49_9LAMI
MELEEQKLEQFKGQARLPEFAVPRRYNLTIKLDLSACTFSGSVLIDVFINGVTKFLVLNALELVISQVSFTSSHKQKYVPSDIVVDGDDEILVLVFEEALDVGYGALEIEFSGVLNEQLKGLYRCTYFDEGEKKNMVATQFEVVDARRCFPCWDEPALKATFKITLESIPSELTALSNMPISEEKHHEHLKTVHFEESLLMSTYLVAIVVLLNAYPLPKLDMVAVPEFSDAAMENFGLITFCETELLQDDLHSAAANVQRLTIVVAHEVAHHWFGNLVTMGWWTHLWLKEGVATWVSYLVTDRLFPEWKIWNRFLQQTTGGLRMDALGQSHPIEVEIHNAQSVLEYFDAICYRKGSAVIRMLQNYLGDEVFQKSLISYMKKYAFKNANTEELWSVLSETSGVEVNKIMDTWTKQKGYPVISVKLNDHTLVFEQTQFLSSALDSDALWLVPLTLSLCSYNNQKRFLLEAKVGNMEIEDVSCSSDVCSSQTTNSNEENIGESWWIKINIHQAGFYRVKYDDNLAAQLRKAIASNSLSATDEFGKQKLGWDATPGESQLNALIREEVLTALACFDHPPTKVEAIKRFQAYLEDRNTSLLPVDTRKVAYIAVMRNASSSDRTGLHCLRKIYREVDAVQEKTRILRCMASCPDPVIVSETLDFMLTDETNWDLIIKKWEMR